MTWTHSALAEYFVTKLRVVFLHALAALFYTHFKRMEVLALHRNSRIGWSPLATRPP